MHGTRVPGFAHHEDKVRMICEAGFTWELRHQWPIPIHLVILTLATAFGLVVWTLIHERLSVRKRIALALIRLTALAIPFLMLGNWSVSHFETELPDLLLLFDNSLSMRLPDGTESNRTRIATARSLLNDDPGNLEALRAAYRVRTYEAGKSLIAMSAPEVELGSLEGSSNESRLGENLLAASQNQRGKATAAIVLFSDGINTAGVDLEVAARQLRNQGIPLYCVGLGTSDPPPELSIDELRFDRRVFLGDQVSIDVVVESALPKPQQGVIRIENMKTGRTLAERTSEFPASQNRATLEFMVPANESGQLDLRASIEPIPGEIYTQNNSKRFSIVVSDDAINVLLVAQRPSYEFRFLKHLFERAKGQGRAGVNLVNLTSVLQDADPRYAEQDRAALGIAARKTRRLGSLGCSCSMRRRC